MGPDELLDLTGLNAALREARRGAGVVTNHFLGPLHADAFPVWRGAASLVFVDVDDGLRRVFYVTRDPADLAATLARIPGPLLLDALVRPPYGVGVDEACVAAGFAPIARYFRMKATGLASRGAARPVRPAGPEFAAGAHALLCGGFDARTDHLPTVDRLRLLAEQGQLFAHGPAERPDAVLAYELEGGQCHWRFWMARPGAHPAVAVRLLGELLSDLARRKIDQGFLWVDVHKTGPMTTFERLGFHPDGLEAHIYAKESP